MIVIRDPLSIRFTKVDRAVFTCRGLTDGAKVLYGYLSGLPTGQNYNDSYILKAMDISQDTLTRRKKELKDIGLILSKQISPRVFMLFVGRLDHPASMVKINWENSHDRLEDINIKENKNDGK